MSSDTGTVTSAFPRRGDISQVGVNVNIPLFASDADQTRRTVTLGVRQQLSAALAAIAQVLDAQGKLFEARRDLSRARYDAWLAYIKLQAVAGTLSETDLAELDGLLLVVETPDLRVVPRRPPRPEAP